MRAITLVLAAASLVVGWGSLLFELVGPTYGTASSYITSSGVTGSSEGTASLIDVGVSPITLFFFGLIALGFLFVFAGALLEYRDKGGRSLMVVGIAPALLLTSISFGLTTLLPATGLGLAATTTSFAGHWTGRPRSGPATNEQPRGAGMWILGAVFGILAAAMVSSFGTPALATSLLVVVLASVGLRRLTFASGAFTAAGAAYIALLLRASASCSEFDRGPNQGCDAPDLTPLVTQGVVVALIGLALGAVDAWASRRRG